MNNEPLVGGNIKRARAAKNWSQADLSRETGISTTALSAYENDKKRPGLDTLATIASALEVSLDRLYYGDQEVAFITSAPNKGRIVANCVLELYRLGILNSRSLYDDDIDLLRNAGIIGYGSIPGEIQAFLHYPRIMGCSSHIRRLLETLIDFERNQETYSDPAAYLKQVIESAANSIDQSLH